MNIQVLERELLQALRGRLSQATLSTKLGFSYNQYYRWERGLVKISWPEFIRVCRVLKIDLKDVCERFLSCAIDDKGLHNILLFLVKNVPLETLTRDLKRPRRTLQRWLSGESQPDLGDILLAMYKTSNWLLEFIDDLVSGRELPSFAAEIAARRQERSFHFKFPEFAGLVRCLELYDYEVAKTHSDDYLAKKSGLTVPLVRKLLAEALKLGILSKNKGKYHVVNKALSTIGNVEGRRKIYAHWTNRVATAIDKADHFYSPDLKTSYLVFTTNAVTSEKLRNIANDYYLAVINALMSDENRTGHSPLDRVMLMQMNLMNLHQTSTPRKP